MTSERSSRSAAGRICVLLVALSVGLGGAGGTANADRALSLLTPGEAVQLRYGPEDALTSPRFRSGPTGPRIVVQEPRVTRTHDGAVIETTPQTRLTIAFEQNFAPVDMESLEIKARKGIFAVSLTPRLKPYIKGTSLRAETVSVPEGRFMIQIEIADRSGSKTIETYRLEVRQLSLDRQSPAGSIGASVDTEPDRARVRSGVDAT